MSITFSEGLPQVFEYPYDDLNSNLNNANSKAKEDSILKAGIRQFRNVLYSNLLCFRSVANLTNILRS